MPYLSGQEVAEVIDGQRWAAHTFLIGLTAVVDDRITVASRELRFQALPAQAFRPVDF
jgi:hypothetical protein